MEKNVASWMDLHPPLLGLILDRLPITDFLRFAAVCVSWRNVQHDHSLYLHPRREGQLPWLMSVKDEHFYNLSEEKYYKISLPKMVREKRFFGTSHGWLIFVDNVTNHGWPMFVDNVCVSNAALANLCLWLVNPFTGSVLRIPILRQMLPIRDRYTCVLSSAPTDPNCVILFGAYYGRKFFYQFREKEWRSLDVDIIGNPVNSGGNIFWHCPAGQNVILTTLEFLDNIPSLRHTPIKRGPDSTYNSLQVMLESDGQFLLTSILMEGSGIKKVEVFNVDLTNGALSRLKDLGDRVLYCSLTWQETSFCLSAVDTGGPGNRIYIKQSLGYEGHKWIEYDFATRREIMREVPKLPNLFGHCIEMQWIVPSVY